MTHGDQAKAKTAKSSQASATKKTSSKTAGKAVQVGKSGKAGKAGVKEAGQSSKAGKIDVKKQQAGSEKGGPSSLQKAALPAKESGNSGKGKTRPATAAAAPDDAAPGFTNAAVAAAFKRALKKYPNALRKLTD
ncbi:MAG: hypothetical protein ACXW5U_16485 [Thermoanaerobaculia bacterium]